MMRETVISILSETENRMNFECLKITISQENLD